MSFTYGQLKQAIQDYTENDETSFMTNLPLFIRQAEERILKNVQLNLFRKNVTATVTAGNEYLGIPGDYLAPFSLSMRGPDEEKFFIDFKDPSFIQTYTTNPATLGAPVYYSVFDVSNFVLAPTPNVAYTAELHYLYRPLSLTSGSDAATTWLSTNAELAMLYGSLIEAYIYMKGEQDVMAMYNQRLTEAINGIKMLGEAKETTQNYRVGPVIRDKQ